MDVRSSLDAFRADCASCDLDAPGQRFASRSTSSVSRTRSWSSSRAATSSRCGSSESDARTHVADERLDTARLVRLSKYLAKHLRHHPFVVSANGVWLVDGVPPERLRRLPREP